jgi:hypothetical protein
MRVVPDSSAAVGAAARLEARKGTAAADPVIGVTPEGQTLPGAVVDGEFVGADDLPRPGHKVAPSDEEKARTVKAGEVPRPVGGEVPRPVAGSGGEGRDDER